MGPLSEYSLTVYPSTLLSQRLPLFQLLGSRLAHSLSESNVLSPSGTCEGDIHMRSDSRVNVDEYAQVLTIPFG